jgi:uncharacterized repeat protein (TIGR01451 family)
VQEPGEPPIAGVIVMLAGPGGVVQTTTDASGAYSFTNLISGAPYTVTFITPPDYQPTLTSGGVDDPANSDSNTAGQVIVTLAPGQHNPNIDAGFWQPATLGDNVWLDVDRDGAQDPGEPPVAGVVVTLLTPTGAVTATTSLTGFYQFVGLTPGTPYSVSFGLPAGGYTWTVQNGGVNDAANSDARLDGSVPPITLAPGENNPRIDAGLWIAPRVGLAKVSLNPGAAKPGQEIRYQIVVTNSGPTLARNLVITDSAPEGTVYVGGSATPAAQILGQTVIWSLGDLAPGGVMTVTMAVRVESEPRVLTIRNIAYVDGEGIAVSIASNEVLNPLQATAISLDRFGADLVAGGVSVVWRTSAENDTLGFNVYRSTTGQRSSAVKINDALIPSTGAGSEYAFVDANGAAGAGYWLQEIELDGGVREYGPALVATSALSRVEETRGREHAIGAIPVAPVASAAGAGQLAVAPAVGESGQRIAPGSASTIAQPADSEALAAPVAQPPAPVIVGDASAPAVVAVPQPAATAAPAAQPMPAATAIVADVPPAAVQADNVRVQTAQQSAPPAQRVAPGQATGLSVMPLVIGLLALAMLIGVAVLGTSAALLVQRRRR